MKLYRFIILIILLLPTLLFSQVSEEAKKLYDEGKYRQAKLAFEKNLEDDPTNSTISYLLGMAAMHTGDIETAEQALTFAKKKRVHDATLYLGRLYAIQYKFEEAEKEFVAYQKAMRRNEEALAELEKEREYADRLQRLVTRTEDIQIIDSVVVHKNEFLNAYNLSLSGGSLEWARDFFDGGFDDDNSVVFMNERKTKVYFSRLATEQGSTLYTMEKLLNNFGNEKMLGDPITNKQDQAYPFILSDGLTIYFASKGHESIGGYDLYASRYNLNSNTYLTPNQMNMPFNSPFNDYMMVIDEQKGVGWFASDRYQPEGQVCVYTFIPNQDVLLVQSEDIDTLANRAKISNIKDSWRSNVDYTKLLEKASTKIVSSIVKEQDFEFVINNEYTYHQLSDFKSFSAREHFMKAMEAEEKLKQTKKELEIKRTQYASLPTDSKLSMTFEILELEKKEVTLYDQHKIRKVMARNEEVRHINAL
ncbi:MAG: tetratricopeptide repeat protein [Dysgonamonadaceae bacterium]|nr:tetratricopeptide repeat protein [Dysgonamonadaceae bacterium]MDD4728608.1 tetratricopeptide repeat protein [Dysgonamonadaceae bacterium]